LNEDLNENNDTEAEEYEENLLEDNNESSRKHKRNDDVHSSSMNR